MIHEHTLEVMRREKMEENLKRLSFNIIGYTSRGNADILVKAGTGLGKSDGYILAAHTIIMKERERQKVVSLKAPAVLIFTQTSDKAKEILAKVYKYCKGIKIFNGMGGKGNDFIRDEIKNGFEIIVGGFAKFTGKLGRINGSPKSEVKFDLSCVKLIIFDEATTFYNIPHRFDKLKEFAPDIFKAIKIFCDTELDIAKIKQLCKNSYALECAYLIKEETVETFYTNKAVLGIND
uniref:DEAD domain-containing protein n=1 Tax=Rhabditophanes sp. KR3021 TaxID=114890 RepID=A0AC35TZE5_9BILA